MSFKTRGTVQTPSHRTFKGKGKGVTVTPTPPLPKGVSPEGRSHGTVGSHLPGLDPVENENEPKTEPLIKYFKISLNLNFIRRPSDTSHETPSGCKGEKQDCRLIRTPPKDRVGSPLKRSGKIGPLIGLLRFTHTL